MIEKIIIFLNNLYSNEGYFVKEFSDDLFFGKDRDNNVICAKVNNSKELSFSMTTKAIDLYQNYNFSLTTKEGEKVGKFDLLVLKNSLYDTKSTFVNLCLNFYNDNPDKSVIELTNDLIEMYKVPSGKDSKFEQGLWAELFTIIYISKIFDKNISSYWHNDNFNKYDFSLSENKKLEVKSTSKEVREHRFSHSQIYTKYDVFVSSVMVRKDDKGYTVFDLYKQVEELFSSHYDLLIKIEKELKKLDKNNLDKYDFEYSIENIKFYINKNMPHFNHTEPDGVYGTEYTVLLENSRELNNEEILNILGDLNE